jgi:iron complex transport system substrate-binding protein
MKKAFTSLILLIFLQAICFLQVYAGGTKEKEGKPEVTQPRIQEEQETVIIDTDTDQFPHKIEAVYAEGFTVEYHNTYKVVRVLKPYPGVQKGFDYLLVQRGALIPEGHSDSVVIRVPVRSFVSFSSTYLSGLEMLGVRNTLVGVDSRNSIYSPEIREKIKSYKILEVSDEYQPNIELLLEIDPDCIMASAAGNKWDVHPKMVEVNLSIVINGDWNEKHPLGRAEWIKFLSLFYNKEKEANTIFNEIERQYLMIKQAATSADYFPTIFSGAPYNDIWYMPGGESFLARFFSDAGGDYIWKDTVATGGLPLSFETVFYKAENADFWLNAGWNHTSKEDMVKSDERFAKFKAFRTGNVYANNRRVAPEGGNDYWESGIMNPHVILADLVKILHPEIIQDHELFYYQQLK